MKGIDIARKLQISTSALRHYESWGLVPKVERASNGYRIYTMQHEAYFQCIRDMIPGFGMEFVKEILPLVIKGEKLTVLWKINKEQVKLHSEKETVLRTIEMIDAIERSEIPKLFSKDEFTIGEAAQWTNVSPSSIRHWEKEGLIIPKRHKESGFRVFNSADLRKILIIRTVQRVVYLLDTVREILSDLDNNDVNQAKEIALQSLQYIDHRLVAQMVGIASLNKLFDMESISSFER